MNKNVIIDITSYIRHLTKKVIKVSLAMILVVEMLSGSITGVWKGFNSTKTEAADNVEIEVELIYKVALNEGLRFAIREGGRTVGSVLSG